ncbi:MAG TPA: hypothetical protein VJM31_10580 [Vicinamibacterales bacterium]|nr:hypothetical protein [Vicinamibacterales bacterium]
MKQVLLLTALVLVGIAPAEAQEIAGEFDQLRVLVKQGDTLTITDAMGGRTQGTLSKLSGSSLILNVAGAPREFLEADVDTIKKRGSDSLSNGALIGMGIGGVLAGLAFVATVEGSSAGWAALGGLVYGSGLGAGIGAGVDALVEGQRVIYAGSNTKRPTVSIVPILRGERKGISLSMRLGK